MDIPVRLRCVSATCCCFALLFQLVLFTCDAMASPMKLLGTAEASSHEKETTVLECTINENGGLIEIAIVNHGMESIAINAVFLGLNNNIALDRELLPHLHVNHNTDIMFATDQQTPAIPETDVLEPFMLYKAATDRACPKHKLHPGEQVLIQFEIIDNSDNANALVSDELVFGLHAAPIEYHYPDAATWYVASPTYRSAAFLDPAALTLLALGMAGMAIRQGKRMVRNR